MKPISIDKPCSENWGAMTPSQQGAFCGKCQIDVVDFSNKSSLEVKLILQENVGKHMCGRFKKTQLDTINLEYTNWETQSLRTFQSKFVYALVVVFGMTLFSCNGPDNMIMGEIAPEEYYLPDSTSHRENIDRIEMQGTFSNYGLSNESEIDTTKKHNNEREYLKGKVAYNYVEEEIIPAETSIESAYIKGDFAYTPDTIVAEEPIIDTTETEFIKGEIEAPVIYTLGEIYIPEETIVKIDSAITEEPVIIENDPAVSNCTNKIAANFSASLFPNPTGEVATVIVIIENEDNFTIELFDISGQKLARVYDGRLSSGRQQFAIAMHNYEVGTYILVITDSNFSQTLKIQKVD